MRHSLFILAALLAVGTFPALAQTDSKEQLTVPLSNPSQPGSLEVGLLNGTIKVVGYTGKQVEIEAVAGSSSASSTRNRDGAKEKSDNTNERLNENLNRNRRDDTKLSEGMKRIPMGNPFDLSAEESNNRIKVSSNSLRTPVNLTIRVPQRFSLKLSTVNRGNIVVENVTGDLEINNVNGAIELTNISGSAVANTVSGLLVATFREINDKPMAFSTLSGRVDVTFPASAKANVKIKSDWGEVFSDFDIDVMQSPSKTTRNSQSGMYRVSVDDWVYGKINGGGSEVMIKSMQGNIYVRKAK